MLTRVEDPAFFDHAGVSLAKGQGFATISGAVARDLYLDGADFTVRALVLGQCRPAGWFDTALEQCSGKP